MFFCIIKGAHLWTDVSNFKIRNCVILLTLLFSPWWQCHYSYNACGLGSDGTDRLVNLVQEIQHRKTTSQHGGSSLFGAKITGGGSGGSVCVIGKNSLKSSEEIFEVSVYVFLGKIPRHAPEATPELIVPSEHPEFSNYKHVNYNHITNSPLISHPKR